MLRSLLRRDGLNARWQMGHPHSRLRAIHVLPSRAASPHRLPTYVPGIKAGFFDRLQDIDPHEPVLAFVLGTKRTPRNPLHRAAPIVRESQCSIARDGD